MRSRCPCRAGSSSLGSPAPHLALLQETAKAAPSYALGWVLLARLWAAGDRAVEALDAAGQVAQLALKSRSPISWEWAGCRTRGLLRDLVTDGVPVLAELARVDPVQSRLESALVSPGHKLLEAFLEEDEASPSQLVRARHGLRRRIGGFPEHVWSGSTYDVSKTEMAWEALLHDPARADRHLLSMGWMPTSSAGPPPRLAEPSVDDLVALAEQGLWEDTEWSDAADKAIAEGGPEVFIRLLDGAWGPPTVEWRLRLRALDEIRQHGARPDAASSRAIASEDGWTDAQAAVL